MHIVPYLIDHGCCCVNGRTIRNNYIESRDKVIGPFQGQYDHE